MYNLDELKKTIKYPTSLIVGGMDVIGVELAKALLEQGGYVIMVDNADEEFREIIEELSEYKLFAYYDYSQLLRFEDHLRRLDYVFYLSHTINNLETEISSQDFLEFSKFLDQVLVLSTHYNAKFLASTSITAHQSLVESKVHAIELGDTDRIHTVYTQAEIQRYTESLSLEYHDKSQLNARIVRLGTIIGADSYLKYDSKLGSLINDALFSDEIKVQGDGLDSDYYIDVKDAVYGIIKAQFSKDTNGEIFSIAYENEISVLSIVYKINELIEYPKEIVFTNVDNNYKAFRLYKPAPNLMRVGWSPRVGFERALKQTIEDFEQRRELEIMNSENEELTEEQEDYHPPKRSFLYRLFFKDDPSINTYNANDGALAHLIAERKKSGEARKGSILMANKKLDAQSSRNIRPRTSRMKGSLIRAFDRFMAPFESLRYITIRQFFLLVLLSALLVVLYFNVFVVLVDLIKQAVLINNSGSVVAKELKESPNYIYDYSNDYKVVSDSFSSVGSNLELYGFLNDWEAYNRLKTRSSVIEGSLEKISSGISDLDFVLDDLKEYLAAYNENIVYKQYNQSVLAVENEDLILGDFSDFDANHQIANDGLNTFGEGIEELSNVNIEGTNAYVEGFMNNFIENARKTYNLYSNLNKINKFLPSLMGEDGNKNYVVLLVDNTIYSPVGGYPISELYITYNSGKLEEISLINSDENAKVNNIDELSLEEINLIKNTPLSNNDVVLKDLMLQDQGNIYFESLRNFYTQKADVETLDGIIVMNLTMLSDLLNLQEPIMIENTTFTKETFISNINKLVEENDNDIKFKKELINNIFALAIQNIVNNLDSNIFELTAILENNIKEKNLTYSFSAGLFNSSLRINNRSDDEIQNVTDYIAISAIQEEPKLNINPIELKTEIDVTIGSEGEVRKTVEIENENKQILSGIVVCMPLGSSGFEFLESTQLATDVRVNSYETCLKLRPLDSGIYKFSYSTPRIEFAENQEGQDWDYNFGVRKQPGTIFGLDLEVNASNHVIMQVEGLEKRGDNRAGINTNITSDHVVRVDLN